MQKWHQTVKRVFERRLSRQREREAASVKQSLVAKDRSTQGISKESREFFETIEKGEKFSENVEFKFAQKFDDFNAMSTMVALTSGMKAADVGITKNECANEIARSFVNGSYLR